VPQESLDAVRRLMGDKTTSELTYIWVENDRDTWSSEAFEAIRRVLVERGEWIPPQRAREPGTGGQADVSRPCPAGMAVIAVLLGLAAAGYVLSLSMNAVGLLHVTISKGQAILGALTLGAWVLSIVAIAGRFKWGWHFILAVYALSIIRDLGQLVLGTGLGTGPDGMVVLDLVGATVIAVYVYRKKSFFFR